MDLVASGPLILFLAIGTVAVASSILVVALRNPIHCALFLMLTFLCVAMIFILAEAEFVGAVQLLVYAGGVMVLFLFVVMLMNVRDMPNEPMLSPYWKAAIVVGAALFVLFGTIVRGGAYRDATPTSDALRTMTLEGSAPELVGNSEAVGMVLYQEYLVPFEVASLFLLVAMIGAIVIGKRQLMAEEEEFVPQFILDRAAEEKREKEEIGA